MDIDDFSTRLKFIARQKGFTDASLARAIGTDRRVVRHWMRADCYPQLYLFNELCNALEVSADYLLTGKDRRI